MTTRKAKKKLSPVKTVQEPAAAAYVADAVARQAAVRGLAIPAGDFKAQCLALMDQVAATGREIVITKRNRPVARLVPVIEPTAPPFLGRSQDIITVVGDIVAPVAPDWDVDADL